MCASYPLLVPVAMARRREPLDVMHLIIISAWGEGYGELDQCVSYKE